ncbi:MAG: glycosyltransferase family 2 protein [Dysgonomonas sp.]
MESSLISVIMPAYNVEKYVAEAIESILIQTFTNFEFIIIDDGSSDETANIIKTYTDPRIIYIRNEKNMGLIWSLNYGIRLSKGKYIARMDADDISRPERFQRQYDFMERHSDISVLGTGFLYMHTGIEYCQPSNNDQIRIKLMCKSSLAHPTVMMRKSDLDHNKLSYDTSYLYAEDYRLWVEFALNDLKLANLAEILLNYRVHDTQISTERAQEQTVMTARIRKEYINTLCHNIFNESELEIINNDFKNISLSDILLVIEKLKDCNDKRHFFNIKMFNIYLWNKIALLISKIELLNIVKSNYTLGFKKWITYNYIKKIVKNIFA